MQKVVITLLLTSIKG